MTQATPIENNNDATETEHCLTAQRDSIGTTIDIRFDGLFFLTFTQPDARGMSEECHAGMVTTAFDHELLITVTETLLAGTSAPKQDLAYRMRISRTTLRLLDQIRFNFHVEKPGVTRKDYHGKIDRSNRNLYPENFGWIIDLENDEMYDKCFPIVPGVLRPVMVFNAGEFYSVQESISSVPYVKTRGDQILSNFGYVATEIGARIILGPSEELFIEFGGGSFPFKGRPGAKYKVNLRYVCPKYYDADYEHKNESSVVMDAEGDGRSDLQYFCHALQGLCVPEWLDLRPGHTKMEGRPPLICYAVMASQTETLI